MKKEKEKIYELRIDDEDSLSGIDSISLVSEPAIEVNWIAFNKDKGKKFDIPEGEDHKYCDLILEKGQLEDDLFKEGWEIASEDFISSSPNAESVEDTTEYLYRYRYILNPQASGAPIKPTTRDFCRDLLGKNYVYRLEDLLEIKNDEGSSAADWRGGYNCRHIWQKITYRRDTKIVNKASVREGRVEGGESLDIWGYTQNDTRTENPSFSKAMFQDDEKRIIVGPAMIPNLEIYRLDANNNPYYVYFSEETIRMIAEKYMKNKYIDNNDTDHNGKAAEDVYVIESWIKESNEDKSNLYGFKELPVGTWFVMMKVRNDEVWQKVKNKELNGFSVSGYFEEIAEFCKEEMFLKELTDILKKY